MGLTGTGVEAKAGPLGEALEGQAVAALESATEAGAEAGLPVGRVHREWISRHEVATFAAGL
jgi:hypothetical protein